MMRATFLAQRLATASLLALTTACGMRERAVITETPAGGDSVTTVLLTASPSGARSANLGWTVEGVPVPASGVLVFRDDRVVATSTGAGWLDEGLAPSTPYRYRVALQRADGKAAILSNVVHLSTPPAAALRIDITPASNDALLGTPVQLIATVRDSATGAVETGHTVTWSTSDGSMATVSPSGLFTPHRTGQVTVTASIPATQAQKPMQIAAPAPPRAASITVSPSTSTVDAGQKVQLTAIARDSAGNILARSFSWSSSNAAVGTISDSGLVTTVAAGTITLTARTDDLSGVAQVTVRTPPSGGPVDVATLTIEPAQLALNPGGQAQLTAIVRDGQGRVLTGRTVVWGTENAAIATVSNAGRVTAVAVGSTVIVATSGGATGTALVNVSTPPPPPPAPVASISVTPPTATTAVGGAVQFSATVRDANGTQLNGRTVTWSTSNAAIATIAADGRATAKAAGSATITATSEGKSSTATLTVQVNAPPPASVATVTVTPSNPTVSLGNSLPLTAQVKDASGTVLTGRVVTWSSSAPNVVSVSSSGVVNALASGAATVTATSEGVSGMTTVTVPAPPAPVPVHAVTVTPSPVTLPIGGSVQLSATTTDAQSNVLAGRPVTWASSDPGVATVSSTGLVSAIAAGSATITATSEGKTGTASLTVSPPPVATVAVTPSPASVQVGLTVQLTAVTKDGNGNVLPGRVVTWVSSNPSVATVSASGLVTGVAAGSANVTATSEGISTVVAVSVAPRAVASVTINTITAFCAGASLQLVATPRDSDGNILTGRAVVWTTNTGAVATVSPTGLLVGLTVGTVTITATIEGVSASVTLSLCPPVVATVSITPPPSILSLLAAPLQLIATAKDGNGNVVTGRPVTWSVTPSNRALVVGGLVTPLLLGGITVTATIDGVSASVSLTIGL